jgi:Ser/Thr protein kinase RdoA (MazF antagonist)
VPAPRFLGAYDDGDWIALVLEDVDGRHPRLPWNADELTAVLAALRDVAAALTPPPIADLPTVREVWEDDLRGWHRVAADPPADLDPWVRAQLPLLTRQADHAITALDGHTGVHMDIRADNLLIRPDGQVIVVDWPWLSRGPAWLDSTLLMASVLRFGNGAHDLNALLCGIGQEFDVTVEVLRSVLVGFAGFYIDAARMPSIKGLPTVGAWRKAQGDALVEWIAEIYP